MAPSESDPSASTPDRRQRIAKLMARAGLCSRRDAEAWIVAGRVSVNGAVLSSPAVDVGQGDAILVDGAPLPAIEKTRLFLFHKPRGLVTSDHDPEGRATVADFLRGHWPQGPRVVTIGRLDINTEGLLLLTNDGGLARTLELPQTGWLRRYRVRAKGTADPAALDALADGITIDGVTYAGIEAKLDRAQGANVWLTMGLREGKNREVKRVLEHLGLEVNRLIRLSFGPFQLAELPEGAVEEVRTRVLRDQLGAKLAAQAGVDFDPIGSDRPQTQRIAPETRKAERRSDARPDRDQRPQEHRKPQAQARQSEIRPDRSSRPRPGRPEHGSRSTETRPGVRHARRRPSTEEAPPPKRERPTGGPRKHVATLRKEAGAPGGPRTRIERSDTRDRRDRTVAVERLVSPRGPSPETRPPRGRTERRGSPPTENANPRRRREPNDRTRRTADERPSKRPGADEARRRDRRDAGAGKQRRHASPSAEGKRERIARSGPRREEPARDGSAGERPSAAGRTRAPGKPLRRNSSADERPGRAPRSASGKPSPSRRGKPGETPRSGPRKGPGTGRPTGPRKGAAGRPRGPSKPKR